MAAQFGRARRPDNVPTVLLQGRVAPDARERVAQAAEESGVSVSYYLERLIRDLVMEHGALPLVDKPVPQREELPIPAA
ncbi:hypothetical protein ACFSBZ_16315 [Amnibacterium flavum]|nr:hypothetical protein [Amnibacterium flavum]